MKYRYFIFTAILFLVFSCDSEVGQVVSEVIFGETQQTSQGGSDEEPAGVAEFGEDSDESGGSSGDGRLERAYNDLSGTNESGSNEGSSDSENETDSQSGKGSERAQEVSHGQQGEKQSSSDSNGNAGSDGSNGSSGDDSENAGDDNDGTNDNSSDDSREGESYGDSSDRSGTGSDTDNGRESDSDRDSEDGDDSSDSGRESENADQSSDNGSGNGSVSKNEYQTIEELFGTTPEFFAAAKGETNYRGASSAFVDLVLSDLIVNVNNSRAGTFKIDVAFDVNGELPKNGTYHIDIINEYEESVGFINLKVKKKGSVTAQGKLKLENSYETLVFSLKNTNSEKKTKHYEETLQVLRITSFTISAREIDLQ